MTRNTALVVVIVTAVALPAVASCSTSSGGSARPAQTVSRTPSATPTGVEDYLVKPCRYFTLSDVVHMFPTPPGMKRRQEVGPDSGECHWFLNGTIAGNEQRPRDEFGLVIAARAPQYGPPPPPSEPDFANVPPKSLAQVKAGVRRVHVGAASGWFHPYYDIGGGQRSATQLDLSVGQYNLLIYADTVLWGNQYGSVEDAATAASDLAAAEKIATTVIARLPATPPPP